MDGRQSSLGTACCVITQQTLASRIAKPGPGNDTRLMSVDTMTGASTELPAVGVKINPSALDQNEIGYIPQGHAGPWHLLPERPAGPLGSLVERRRGRPTEVSMRLSTNVFKTRRCHCERLSAWIGTTSWKITTGSTIPSFVQSG